MIFIKKWFFIGILFIIAGGSLLHFTYEWSNRNFIVGLFSAQNESVFEHTKLLVLPILLWYILSYKFSVIKPDKKKYFASMIISLIISILTIPLLFYTYKVGFNLNNAFINIFNFCISGLFGQLIAYHYYKYGTYILPEFLIILLILLLIIIYTFFSIYPLKLPIFETF